MELKNPQLFKQQSYIHGKWMNATDGSTFEVHNPFDNSLIGTVPNMGQKEAKLAIEAAHTALDSWKNKTVKERGVILKRWADLIEANKEDLAKIMTIEQGKPLKEAMGEIDYANAFNYWFIEEAKRVYGDIIPTVNNDRRLLVIKQPIGVCAAITPWNFPSAMIARKAAPALAVGCTIVIKPAEATPYSALAMALLAHDAGIPPGVLNIITGDPAAIGNEFSSNPIVKKLTFTGSTRVGKLLMKQGSETVKKLSLELGGNAPFIVFDDADISSSVLGLMITKFRNAGQTCVSANRIYVHEKVYEAFIEKLLPQVKALKVGNGLEDGVNVGPLINEAAIQKVDTLVQEAIKKGAKVLCGGNKDSCSPHAYQPTILTDIPEGVAIRHDEIFGPVIAIYKFKDEADVIKIANDTRYGLASYFYSRDIGRVWRVAEALEYGMVSINQGLFSSEAAPFGGVKESGFGREGSKYGLEDYIIIKYLCMGL